MKKSNIQKGVIGEKAAVELLKKKGFKIIETNYRTRFGEIDIIGRDGEVIVFVEVKTKTGDQFGEPWEMMNKRKLGQIKRIGKMYLVKKEMGDAVCRIDVVGVWLDYQGEVQKTEHWDNVTS